MRKWRKGIAACLFSAVLILPAGPALARVSLAGAESTYDRVYDMAGIFSDEEEAALSAAIESQRTDMDMDLAIVTAGDAMGYGGQEFADYFYDDNGLGEGSDKSGVLLLLDMDNREIGRAHV